MEIKKLITTLIDDPRIDEESKHLYQLTKSKDGIYQISKTKSIEDPGENIVSFIINDDSLKVLDNEKNNAQFILSTLQQMNSFRQYYDTSNCCVM
jgi:hypothetical protein